jgi:hypothetical protein
MSAYFPFLWRLGSLSFLAIPLVGAMIFIVIGWRMMKDGR